MVTSTPTYISANIAMTCTSFKLRICLYLLVLTASLSVPLSPASCRIAGGETAFQRRTIVPSRLGTLTFLPLATEDQGGACDDSEV